MVSTNAGINIGTSFPTFRFANAMSGGGFTDYIAAIKRGLLSGKLFVAYSQGIATSDTKCPSCNGQNWKLPVYGAKVTP